MTMPIRTYDRNVSKSLALIADDDFSKVRYVHIARASTVIEDVSFKTLRNLHLAVFANTGETNLVFDPKLWVRYREHLALNQNIRCKFETYQPPDAEIYRVML